MKKKIMKTVMSRQFFLATVLRLQAYSKLLCVAGDAGSFKLYRSILDGEVQKLLAWDDAIIERTFAVSAKGTPQRLGKKKTG